jgi:DNA-binding MarR family transcriptional regulator
MAGSALRSSPRAHDSATEIERALSVLARRETRRRFYEQLLSESGIELSPLEAWTLARVREGTPGPTGRLAARIDVDPARISTALAELDRRELVRPADAWYVPTPEGSEIVARIVEGRRTRLAARLEGWRPDQHEELARILHGLAHDLLHEPPRETVER